LYLDAGNLTSYSGTGTIWNDLTGYSVNTELVGATYSTANGGCFVFNGTSQYAVTSTAVKGTGYSVLSQTYIMWVSPNDTDGNLFVMTPGYPTQSIWFMPPLAVSGSRFRGWIYANTQLTSSLYTNNQWYHVCVTFDVSNNANRFYVNGTLVASGTGSYSSSGQNNHFHFARDSPGGVGNTGWFAGRIAVVEAYTNRALSLAEIQDRYNADRERFGL
jgi:hypothetical protein